MMRLHGVQGAAEHPHSHPLAPRLPGAGWATLHAWFPSLGKHLGVGSGTDAADSSPAHGRHHLEASSPAIPGSGPRLIGAGSEAADGDTKSASGGSPARQAAADGTKALRCLREETAAETTLTDREMYYHPAESFDTVVDTFGLCSCSDPVAALQEMKKARLVARPADVSMKAHAVINALLSYLTCALIHLAHIPLCSCMLADSEPYKSVSKCRWHMCRC
jgi:hypothetical protein